MSEVPLYIVKMIESLRLNVQGTRNLIPRAMGWVN